MALFILDQIAPLLHIAQQLNREERMAPSTSGQLLSEVFVEQVRRVACVQESIDKGPASG